MTAGGPSVYNPFPLSNFIDIFLMGEFDFEIKNFVDIIYNLKKNKAKKERYIKRIIKIRIRLYSEIS